MNTELAVLTPEYVDVWDEPTDKLKEEIDSLLSAIRNQERSLATSHARLGWKLLHVQKEKRWVGWGFESFGKYIDAVREHIDRGRASIYSYIDVAEKLLPAISEEDLDKMGISRAQELARYVKQSGMSVPEHLLIDALNPKVKLDKLHANVLEALHEKCDPKGSWFDPGGFYALPDEKLEIQQAYDLAARTDPPIPADTPDHIRRLEIMLRLCREFVSSNPEETA